LDRIRNLVRLVDMRHKEMMKDRNAESVVGRIVGIAIGIFVVATIIPVALVELAGANLTGVDPAVTTILTILLPILSVVAIALMFLYKN